ncbi:MAG: hypothetical protein ACKO96_00870, partial [Flammeovirgaceae bacterium]
QGWLWTCGCPCAATREALDILGAVATFACRGRNAKTTRLSDQVLTITGDPISQYDCFHWLFSIGNYSDS